MKILFVASLIGLILAYHDPGIIVALLIVLVLSGIVTGVSWIYATLILSSIPAGWYAVTAYVTSLLGIPPHISLVDAAMIYVRMLSYSEIILFAASMISPVKTTNILRMLGLKSSSILPLLMWRLMPLGLRYMEESMMIGQLKGEPATRRIAPALAMMIEAGEKIHRANYHRLKTPISGKLRVTCVSGRAEILLVATSILVIIAIILKLLP